MKTLVIYYSFEGNTRFVAKIIAKKLKADLLELIPKKELIKSHGFSKYFWGGKQVLMKEKPNLEPINKKPSDYHQIFIGTPVWAWTYTPPIRTLLSKQLIKDKKVFIFCTCDDSKGLTLKNLKKKLSKNNQVISEQEFKKPLKNKALIKSKVINWLNTN